MSAVNGDKSRFNRERKQKIAHRQKVREVLKQAPAQPKPGARKGTKSEAVSA